MLTATLGQLRQRAREMADMVDSDFVSTSEELSYINSSYAELYDILVSAQEDYYLTSTEVTISSGSSSVSLPADFYKLRGVDYKLTTNSYTGLKRFDFTARNSTRNGFGGSESREYRVVGNDFHITPTDAAAGTYRLWYVPAITLLSDDSDTVDGVNGWEEYIVVDVAMKMLRKEESSVSHLEKQKQSLIQRITKMSNTRDEHLPDSVVDVNGLFLDEDEYL